MAWNNISKYLEKFFHHNAAKKILPKRGGEGLK